jgi:GT2 family glycosyltransferase
MRIGCSARRHVVQPETPRPGVTVAIATLDRPERLRRCVSAILAGRALPSEIVIVDQSANDATATMVAAANWADRIPIRYLRQSRLGLAASRNLAIEHVSQPIVAFTDDDCVPDSGWLAALLATFEGDDSPDVVTGAVLPLEPENGSLHPVSTRTSPTRALYRGRSLPWAVGTGGNAAVRRDWLERVGGFDERLGAGSRGQSAEDLELFYRLLRGGAVVRYEPDAVVFHEQQTVAARIRRTQSYAFGMGTLCAMWARQRDGYACWIVARWCIDRVDTLLRATLRRQWWRIREELLTIRGAVRGVPYGLMLAAQDRVAVAAPPSRVSEAAR